MRIINISLTFLTAILLAVGGYLWIQLDATRNEVTDVTNQLAIATRTLESTENQLKNTEDTLEVTENQLQNAINDYNLILERYTGYQREIDYRAGLYNEDRQEFITPNNNLVSEKVQEITGGYSDDTSERWGDYYRLYQWVVNNISYSYDSYIPRLPHPLVDSELSWVSSYWRYPEETITDATGDCEDMALLLASMLLNYDKENYEVWCIEVCPQNSGSSHIGVAFPVQGGKLTIVDPAGNYYTGSGSLSSDTYSIAVDNWLNKWSTKIPQPYIGAVFSCNYYYEFNNTDEFLSWIEDR